MNAGSTDASVVVATQATFGKTEERLDGRPT